MPGPADPFEAFLTSVGTAGNESAKRHLFTALAATGFGDTGFATTLALGAEYQVRFSNTGLVRRGAVDNFFGSLVVEFEKDLGATGAHAQDQLRGYVAGAWTEDGSAEREYIAVATDGLNWEVFVPRLVDPSTGIDASNIRLDPSEQWSPSGDMSEDSAGLRDFLNRLVFRTIKLVPSARNFARDFGLLSPAYLAASDELRAKLSELVADPRRQVLQDKWSDNLQDVYGSVDTDDELFAKHTYLAMLARLLVWVSIDKRQPTSAELDGIVSGAEFVGKRIAADHRNLPRPDH